jgi:TP901 family phage tail tape measure protein
MSVTVAELRVLITANNAQFNTAMGQTQASLIKATSGVNAAQSQFKAFGANLSQIGIAMSAAITAPLALLAKKVIDVGVDYERSMNVFRAVTRATGDEMGRAAQLAQQLGADMTLPATSAGDAAKAMTELAKGGLSASQAMDAAKGTLQLASAATIDEARAAEITANALNAFGLAASDAGRISDLLAGAANASSAEIGDVALALQQASAVFASAHIPIQDLVTAIGEMANAGIKGSDAGTSLKTMMLALEAPTHKAAAEMQRLGINIFDAQGEFIPFRDMIGQVQHALEGMSDKQQAMALKTIFGTDAIRAANIVMVKGVEAFDSMSVAVNRAGAAQELAGAKAKGLSGGLDGLRSQLETVGLAIFNTLSPALEKVVRSVADAVGGFAKLSERTIIMGAAFLGIAGAAGPIALLIGKLLSLSPQGAIIAGVVAGSAAIAAAYAADYAKVNQTINSHVALFKKGANEIGGTGTSLSDKLEIASIAIVNLFDRIAVALERIAVNVVRVSKIAFAALTGDITGVVLAWSEGSAKLDAVWATYENNVAARIGRIHQIQGEAAFRDMWAKNAAVSRAGAEATVKAWEDVFLQHSPALSLKDALEKYHGPTVAAAKAMGADAGTGFLTAWRAGIDKRSPSGFEKDLEQVYEAFVKFPDRIKGIESRLGQAGKDLVNGLRTAMASIIDAIEQPFRDAAIGQIIHDKIAPFVTDFQNKAKALSDTLDTSLIPALQGVRIQTVDFISNAKLGAFFQSWADDIKAAHQGLIDLKDALLKVKEDIANSPIFSELKIKDEAARAFDGVVQMLQREGERLGETQSEINTRILTEMAKMRGSLPPEMTAIFDLVVLNVKRQMDKLPGALDEIFNKLSLGVKHQVSGIFDVINNLPGVFGDNLRKSTDVITKWVTQIDGVLKGLHKIFNAIPDGLTGAIASVIAIFRGTTTAMASATAASATVVESAWNQMASTASIASATMQGAAHKAGDAVDQMGQDSEDGASKMGSAIGKITQALAGISLVVAGHAQGGLQGGLTGALGGIMAGSVFGPWGAAIGGAVGLFAGLFGGGKSALQKAQEAAQLQQAKDAIKLSQQQVEQAFEQTKQSILETASKARELLEAITFYTQVPKDAFKAFFSDLDKLMKAFAEHAKNWMTDASGKIKVFSDDMKAVLEAIANAPTALVGIGKYLGIPEASIAQFFSDLGKVIVAFSTLGEDFTRKFLRHTRQFAERISDAVALIPDITTGIIGLVDIKPIPVGALDIWEDSLRQVTTRIGQIAESFDKYTAKLIGFFAQQIGPAITLWKDSIDAIRAMVDLPMPNAQSFVNLFEEIKQALDGFSGLATSLSTDALVKAQSIAEMSMAIFAAIKSAVEAFGALSNYKSVAQEAIDAIMSDFKRGIILLNLLILDVTEAESKAKTFDQIVTSMASYLNHGVSTYVGAFTNMASALMQMPQGGTSLTPGPGFGSVGGMGSQSMTTQSHTTYISIGDLNIPEGSAAGELIKKLVDELRGIATGGMQRDPLLS